jgi:uncharacterized membrane protein
MGPSLHLWLEYLLRFSHLVAGIYWIGSSFYFIWLDSSFEAPETPRKNVEGETFMVHGGFYYKVEKRKIYPGELPKVLHWFKWEATFTWITGILLLSVLYFLNGASLLIDSSVMQLTQAEAVGLGVGFIIGSWLIYDTIWNPKIQNLKPLQSAVSIVFFAGLIYMLSHIFSGRGAFILFGAICGSMMLANVWIRILPGQAKMVREAQAGQVPDYSVSLKSKARSVHNTYFIFPVLFIMLSNHFPEVYNHQLNWLLLIVISIAGACTRHAMVTKNPVERWTLAPAAVGLLALVYLTAMGLTPPLMEGMAPVQFTQINSIVHSRCIACHSSQPTDDVWKVAPKGIIFESEPQVRAQAAKIFLHVVQAKSMPLGNKTGMTDGERAIVAQWLVQQGLVSKN